MDAVRRAFINVTAKVKNLSASSQSTTSNGDVHDRVCELDLKYVLVRVPIVCTMFILIYVFPTFVFVHGLMRSLLIRSSSGTL
jgi:hypothetical protein